MMILFTYISQKNSESTFILRIFCDVKKKRAFKTLKQTLMFNPVASKMLKENSVETRNTTNTITPMFYY